MREQWLYFHVLTQEVDSKRVDCRNWSRRRRKRKRDEVMANG